LKHEEQEASRIQIATVVVVVVQIRMTAQKERGSPCLFCAAAQKLVRCLFVCVFFCVEQFV
jgi:hypothetical protein